MRSLTPMSNKKLLTYTVNEKAKDMNPVYKSTIVIHEMKHGLKKIVRAI